MPEVTDSALLQEYVDRRAESAFGELVQRYINLVYSVALRQVGNPPDAQDVTQAVFVILAGKAAGLRQRSTLTGWLYETTRLTSRQWLRTKARQQARDQEAYMQSTLDPAGDNQLWRQLAPHLEAAMSRLHTADRELLALRFYQSKTGAEAAVLLGIGESAAHKRTARALEKLQKFFQARGINSTTAVLAESISAHSVHAAPAVLAKTITAVALAKGATASISTATLIKGALKIMAWTKAKTAVIVGAAVILATGTSVVVVKHVHHPRKIVHLAAGALPQTPEELDAWYVEPPAGQNAATFNLRGIDARNVEGVQQMADLPVLGKLPPPDPAAPLPPGQKTALTTFLQRNREALQFFSQGAQFEQGRYPIDLSQGANTILPHLAGVKSAAQICQMATILDADNGNGKKAGDDVVMTLALARSLKAEPTYISQLVRVAAISIAVDGLNQSVNRNTLPAESLSALAKMFQDLEDYDTRGEGFSRALVAERVDHLALLKHPQELARLLDTPGSFNLDDGPRQQMAKHLQNASNLKDEQDFFEATFQQLWTARQAAFPERTKNFDDVLHQRTSEASDRGLLLNKMYWNGLDHAVSREAASLANERLALTALALEQFRAARGNRYPNGLSELAPDYLAAPLMDPFNGQPLHYRKQGAGYVLYSVGPDLKDDGGRRRTGGGNGDIVFAVVNPPAP